MLPFLLPQRSLAGVLALAFALPAVAMADPGVQRIAVYRGEAGCEGCSEAVQWAIERTRGRYAVDFVGPDEAIAVAAVTPARYVAYVQPGGGQNIPAAMDALDDGQAEAIRRFVADGGAFIGVCMGAYLAGTSYLGLIPADLEGEAGRPGFAVRGEVDAAVAVRWKGRQESAYFQDGPYLPRIGRDPGFAVIAQYANGDLAAARYGYGRGTVVLVGPHPEAPGHWFDEAGISRSQMPHGDVFGEVLDAALVPGQAQPRTSM